MLDWGVCTFLEDCGLCFYFVIFRYLERFIRYLDVYRMIGVF